MIIGGLLRTIGALLQDVGNILESLVVERMILEGSPTNTSTPAIYQPLPAAPSAPQHHANDEDEDDHQWLMQRQGRKRRDIPDAVFEGLQADLRTKLDKVRRRNPAKAKDLATSISQVIIAGTGIAFYDPSVRFVLDCNK